MRSPRLFRAAITAVLAVALTFAPPAAHAAQQTISSRTFAATWQWSGVEFPGSTLTHDQHVVSSVAGITSNDRNVGLVLRSDGSTFLRAQVRQAAITLEDNSGVLAVAHRPGSPSVTNGTLDATVEGSTVTINWNGVTAMTYQLTKSYPGTRCGVQVWQDVAHAVSVGATCDDASGQSVGPEVPSGEPTRQPASTTNDWLSGAAGPQAADGSYGAWRGDPVEIAGTWANSAAMYTLQPGAELGSWTKPVDVAISPPDWQGWQAEANGVHDSFYHQIFANLRKARAGHGTTYVRPWYEFNGSWMPYHVSNADIPSFKKAWIRMAAIAREEFPGVQLVFCASASSGSDVYAAFPGARYVDVGGIDFYNNYPWVNSAAGFEDKTNNGAGPYSLNDLQAFYQREGLPFAINEWSNQGAVRTEEQGGGGESPQFIDSMHAWMVAHAGDGTEGQAGKLLYEIQFNLWSDQFQFYPSGQTVQPETAARYAADF